MNKYWLLALWLTYSSNLSAQPQSHFRSLIMKDDHSSLLLCEALKPRLSQAFVDRYKVNLRNYTCRQGPSIYPDSWALVLEFLPTQVAMKIPQHFFVQTWALPTLLEGIAEPDSKTQTTNLAHWNGQRWIMEQTSLASPELTETTLFLDEYNLDQCKVQLGYAIHSFRFSTSLPTGITPENQLLVGCDRLIQVGLQAFVAYAL